MASENLIINAAAGAGKTTRIVEDALAAGDRKLLITTYTNNNEAEIRRKFYELYGSIPANIRIQTWFSFLLEHFVRPYQNAVFSEERVRGLAFVNFRSAPYVGEAKGRPHYFASGPDIYSDKISKFGVRCNENTGGAVIARLEQIFDHILIDEVQDLASWDLDVLELLFSSDIQTTLVGDYRQSTYRTNNAAKYEQFAGAKIIDKFKAWQKIGVCALEEMSFSYRCNQDICDFADRFFPAAGKTASQNQEATGHDGVFVVRTDLVASYVEKYAPQVLRYDRTTNCGGHHALNFGESKGLGFHRVLIYPHGPLKALLGNADFSAIKEPSKLYVATTRARHSVAFVYDGNVGIEGITIYTAE